MTEERAASPTDRLVIAVAIAFAVAFSASMALAFEVAIDGLRLFA